ncbi:hypothetical protein DL89DRAFT_290100 [Linderina pennispora]|uniref:Uncharacterized protein n=1 Tax=Linderina pennispora TaxID=61395 RepID=A0A1Y1WLZ1_9FUNG|nr:uncharacterized protein DL89DRAFT_290100 [Linderina pennispora]ORX74577.1 hypothetical protein DL89DRAFT_290100 [Linderina pennispora]
MSNTDNHVHPQPQPTARTKPLVESAIEFPDEPLLLRMDKTTHAFYKTLTDEADKKMLEVVTHTANVSPILRQASKKDFKKYGNPEYPTITSSIIDKYAERQKVLLSSGTLDLVWGIRWLLSYVVLIDYPLQGTEMALADADILEVLGVAHQELVVSRQLSTMLPGSFNSACSIVFAGELKTIHIAHANGIAGVEEQTEGVAVDAVQTIGGMVDRDSICVSTASVDLRIMCSNNDDGKVSEFDRSIMKDTGTPFELKGTLHRLSDGTRYIDQVTMVWPTYTPLDYVDLAQF